MRKVSPIIIRMKNRRDYRETCEGCPTIFDFKTQNGDDLYFRLRHGYWSLVNQTSDKELACGYSEKDYSVCSWDRALELMRQENVYFDFGERWNHYILWYILK